MKELFLRRILLLFPVLLAVSFVSFALMSFSGSDPAEVALRVNEITPTPEAIETMRQELGLDQPFFARYLTWLSGCLQGNLGTSYIDGDSVTATILGVLPNTLYLAAVTLAMIVAVSLLVGIVCAIYEGRWIDKLLRAIIFFLSAMPSFWAGLLLMWFFAVYLNLLPTSGMYEPSSVILPAVTLSLGYIGTYARLIRNSMCENKQENYVLYLKARGMKHLTIFRHILKNSLHTSLTALGMSIPKLIAGTVVVENIFAWPGIGRECVTAIYNRDYPVIQGYILLMAVLFVICNLMMDLLSIALDPRRNRT